MNNNAYGTIAGLQKAAYGLTHGTLFPAATVGWDAQKPNYAEIARAYGCEGERLKSAADLAPALRRALASGKPYLLDVPMKNNPTPTTGHWNILDIYAPDEAPRARGDGLNVMRRDILVSEVGPRDGLQSIKTIMPLRGQEGVDHRAGGERIARDRSGQLCARRRSCRSSPTRPKSSRMRSPFRISPSPCWCQTCAAPKRPFAAGAHKLTLPFPPRKRTASRTCGARMRRCSMRFAASSHCCVSQPAATRPRLEGGLSTAFGCTYEGDVPADKVVRLAEQLCEAGCDEIGLADSVGYANPAQVRDLVYACASVTGEQKFAGLHLHNTRGLGLANVVAGLEVGVHTFDSSMAGIGGCPFAPGATGNIVTEDLVFMLESMGLDTGIDLDQAAARRARSSRRRCRTKNCMATSPAAGLPLGSRARKPGVERMNTPFSLAHLTMLSVPPPQLVETAARAGYQFVSLRPDSRGRAERTALSARHRSRAARAHQGSADRPPAWVCSISKSRASSRK